MPRPAERPVWWREAVFVAAGYAAYAVARDVHGRAGGVAAALRHGRAVLHAEQLVGLDVERAVQGFFLGHRTVLEGVGGFYGGAHFLVTLGVLGWLLVARPAAYPRWRRLLALVTAVAVALFALYPTAPPRLLPGAGLQDTLVTVGGLWSYNNGVLEHISDPYAAMPSLHLAWACWSAGALAATVGAEWAAWRRWLFALYPLAVGVTVLATGTHWLLDAVAGAALYGLLWAAERAARLAWARRGSAAARAGRPAAPPLPAQVVDGDAEVGEQAA